MSDGFRDAFLWHLDNHDAKMADIARATGVSRDVLAKVKLGHSKSTTVENGILIASFYGKTLNQFLKCEDASRLDRLHALLDLLPRREQELIEAQIEGLLARSSQD